MKPTKVALIIIDGLGLTTETKGNGWLAAKHPLMDQWFASYPSVSLQAAGLAVGLPEKSPGNSLVGHGAIGTGQIGDGPVGRTLADIQSGMIWQNEALEAAFKQAKQHEKKVHLVGLLSDVANHATLELLYALIDAAKQFNYPNRLYLHLWLDGRDTQIRGGQALLEKVYVYLRNVGYGSVATICGRELPMDRLGQQAKTDAAFELLTELKGTTVRSPLEGVMDAYANGHTDETVPPLVADPNGQIEDGDAVVFFNHRPDRMRQLVQRFAAAKLNNCAVVAFQPYYQPFPYPTLYPARLVEPNLGSVVSAAGKKVLKITESDRYAHLTYFFSGGKEDPYYHEERQFVDTKTGRVTALQSLKAVSKQVETALRQAGEELLIVNIPNLDACGHTGDLALVGEAVAAIDHVLADWQVAAGEQWLLVITADHGNIEYMQDPATGEVRTEDTANPVPCLLIHPALKDKEPAGSYAELAGQPPVGVLTDVTTTILHALGVAIPAEMSGVDLLPATE